MALRELCSVGDELNLIILLGILVSKAPEEKPNILDLFVKASIEESALAILNVYLAWAYLAIRLNLK